MKFRIQWLGLFLAVIFWTGCGSQGIGGTETGDPGQEPFPTVGSSPTHPPPTNGAFAREIMFTVCRLLSGQTSTDGCFGGLSYNDCIHGISAVDNIDLEVGIPVDAFHSYTQMIEAEIYGFIVASDAPGMSCLQNIEQLTCDDPLVRTAWSPHDPLNFSHVADLLSDEPDSCPALFAGQL